MRLGEIAAKVETKYGDETLDKLGEELTAALADKSWASVFSEKPLKGDGAAGCTLGRALKRNRSVFRAWDGCGKIGAGAYFLGRPYGASKPFPTAKPSSRPTRA